jgi:hypothetical protein
MYFMKNLLKKVIIALIIAFSAFGVFYGQIGDPSIDLEKDWADRKLQADQNQSTDGSGPDADGWVELDKPIKLKSQVDPLESETSGWVLISKDFDGEKFMVQLPSDANYHSYPTGEMAIESEDGSFSLLVGPQMSLKDIELKLTEEVSGLKAKPLEVTRPSENIFGVVYQDGDETVAKKVHRTDLHTYELKVKSKDLKKADLQKFMRSFEVV